MFSLSKLSATSSRQSLQSCFFGNTNTLSLEQAMSNLTPGHKLVRRVMQQLSIGCSSFRQQLGAMKPAEQSLQSPSPFFLHKSGQKCNSRSKSNGGWQVDCRMMADSHRKYSVRSGALVGEEGAVNLEVAEEMREPEERVGEERQQGQPAKVAVRQRAVSGIQPTGSIHLGNYLGAIKNWVNLQDSCDTLYFIVDLHAITLPHDIEELRRSTHTAAAIYLAAGVDPAKASIFVQSHVKAHSELTWLLSCSTPISWLNRMIQFKEKALKAGEDVGAGLLTYPLLMASDILLYQCDVVPVGEDQRQHLELTRDIASRVNHLYGGKKWKKRGGRGGRVFKVPEVMIPPAGARIMSLTDGTSKMSKSAPQDGSRINLLDSPSDIAGKVKRCKTDSFIGMEYDNPERPECQNLLSIYQIVSGKTKEEVSSEVKDLSWGQFKALLADALVAHLEPIQKKYGEIIAEPGYVESVLAKGADRANEIANATMTDVYDAFGFLPPSKRL